MSVPEKEFLALILDNMNRSRWVDYSMGDPVIRIGGTPDAAIVPLSNMPGGWIDLEIAFGTNQNYWSLNRSYTTPMFFPDTSDGAIIMRDAYWKGRGYQEELYLVILKIDFSTGIYRQEMRGRLDFVNAKDQPRKGITVNAIEGGILQYLTANESVDYEMPLDASNPQCFQTYFDGVTMFDRLQYTGLGIEITAQPPNLFYFTLPLAFLSAEGDSVGIVSGDQQMENLQDYNDYVQNSANCILYSVRPITVTITGSIIIGLKSGHYPTGQCIVFFRRSTQTTGGISTADTIFNVTNVPDPGVHPPQQVGAFFTVNINTTISLAANEKLFILVGLIDNIANNFTFIWQPNLVYFAYNTRNDPSTAFSMFAIDVLKNLVSLMTNGLYTADSNFLRTNKNLIWTSTNSIQNYVFQYFYGSFQTQQIGLTYSIILPGILRTLPTDNQLIISGAASNNGIYTVISVSPLTLGLTTIQVLEPLTNATLSGNISTIAALKLNFKNYFNDLDCLLPKGAAMKILNNVLWVEPKDKIYEADAEMLDIGEITDLELDYATDLLCNTATFGWKSQDYRKRNGLYEYNTTDLFKFPVDVLQKDYTKVMTARGDCYGIEFIRDLIFNLPTSDTTGDNQPFVVNIDLNDPLPGYPVPTYPVLRKNYSSIAGVLDNTVYNIEEMTPHRLLLKHGPFLKSLMVQMPTDKVVFNTGDKNTALSTILDGVQISERADEVISGLGDLLFYPWYALMTTKVPIPFYTIFNQLGTGYIKGTFFGQPIYFLPIGEMKGKPATNEPQQWKLLLAPNNNLTALNNLSLDGVFTSDAMGNEINTSYLNPVHFVKYNFQLEKPYYHAGMDDLLYQDRREFYGKIGDPHYEQKWILKDKIPIQQITKGLGQLYVTVYDQYGKQYKQYPMDIVADPSVRPPYVLNNLTIDPTSDNYAEGLYYFIVGTSETKMRISEWQDIREDHDKTLLIRYSHTNNKFSTYFSDIDFNIRVEATILPPYDDSTFTDYTDELSNYEAIDGLAFEKAMIRIGNSYGVPDYMGRLIGRIFLLNRTYIDLDRYSRTQQSKMTKKAIDGHPFYSYTLEIALAIGKNVLATDEAGDDADGMIAYTIDGQAVGMTTPGAVINIELPNDV